MKANFVKYLRDALDKCRNVKTIKVEFNGFSNDGKELNEIISHLG